MTQLNVLDGARGERSGYKVNVNRGERIGRVSSEWFCRPADERYLSLSELHAAVRGRAERSRTRTAESAAIRVEANRDDAKQLALIVPGNEVPLAPTHWSFAQLATMVGAPSTYLRQLPAPLAAINLQYGLNSHRAELIKTLEVDDGRVELRAVTGPDYSRIYDQELVSAVQRIAGNGTGDTSWKVPGVLDWSTGVYNPHDCRRGRRYLRHGIGLFCWLVFTLAVDQNHVGMPGVNLVEAIPDQTVVVDKLVLNQANVRRAVRPCGEDLLSDMGQRRSLL